MSVRPDHSGALSAALACALLITGCASTPTAAPVIDRSPNAAPAKAIRNGSVEKRLPPAQPAVQAKPAEPAPVVTAVTKPEPSPPPTATAAAKPEPAPVPKAEEPTIRPYREGDWRPEYHVVKKGDTLYSIALDYGQDYRELAAWNNLEDPARIRVDQKLRLFPPESPGEALAPVAIPLPAEAPPSVPVKTEPKGRKLPYSEQALAQLNVPAPKPAPAPPPTVAPAPKPAITVSPSPASPVAKEPAADARLTWEWPTQGKLIYGFGEGANQKGVGIEGRSGQAVLASAPGKVVYSGSGLRGYGKLIIIKHNTSYLSVYAHNSQILVKEGQLVAKGQKIAEMGDTDSDRVALHFEIRRLGKPIDPLQYLPERAS